jgi:repressor LexA
MVESLPARQREVLRFIVELTEQRGFPPTLSDLAKAMGLKNRMTVHQHVTALKNKGMVHWEPGLNRSLRVIGTAQQELSPAPASTAAPASVAPRLQLAEHESEPEAPRNRLPLAGTIAAGRPIDAYQTDEYLEVESRYADSGCYALKIKGDSMIDDGIFDGDFVIIKPNPSPTNGDIVVALLPDDTATLKRFYKEKDRVRLQPANPTMEPIYVNPQEGLVVQGTVVGLFRKF